MKVITIFGVNQKYYSNGEVVITKFTREVPEDSLVNSFSIEKEYDEYNDFFSTLEAATDFAFSEEGLKEQNVRKNIRLERGN